jgi:putative membrane protein
LRHIAASACVLFSNDYQRAEFDRASARSALQRPADPKTPIRAANAVIVIATSGTKAEKPSSLGVEDDWSFQMQRRTVFTALAVASTGLVVSRAMGQTSNAPGMEMGEAEMTHLQETEKVGSLSLATSRAAVEMASNADVKEFAGFEVAEQETVADVLASVQAPADEAEGALKVPTDEEVEAKLDDMGKQTLERLRGLSGAEFDMEYVKAQLEGHNMLLEIQETYLEVGQNREHLSIAKLARGMIREHIAHLEALQSSMG